MLAGQKRKENSVSSPITVTEGRKRRAAEMKNKRMERRQTSTNRRRKGHSGREKSCRGAAKNDRALSEGAKPGERKRGKRKM